MLVFRVGSTLYADDLSGAGARINGGRWNHVGVECLYTSESRALAVLEYTVNVNIHSIPRAISITTIDIGNLSVRELMESDLPGDWKKSPAPASTKNFGSKLIRKAVQAILKIPSSVISEEFNYVLNPTHVDFKKFRVLNISDFVYDVRIKLK
jgi:RES domain-containing protein